MIPIDLKSILEMCYTGLIVQFISIQRDTYQDARKRHIQVFVFQPIMRVEILVNRCIAMIINLIRFTQQTFIHISFA